jgi:hypothetical protein
VNAETKISEVNPETMDEMLSKFMIEDQLLDLAIENADQKERTEVMRQ